MKEYQTKIMRGVTEAVKSLAGEVLAELDNGGVSAETAHEALSAITDFRRYLRTVENGGVAPTRKPRATKKG